MFTGQFFYGIWLKEYGNIINEPWKGQAYTQTNLTGPDFDQIAGVSLTMGAQMMAGLSQSELQL